MKIPVNNQVFCGIHEKYALWKFKVDFVHAFVSSLQPGVDRGFLHVSNVFLYNLLPVQKQKAKILQYHEMCGK